MTGREFSVLLKAIKDIYDRKDFLDTDSKKSTWFALLKDLDYKTAANALQAYMSSPDGHFEPKPADIRRYAVKAQPENDYPSDQEALGMVILAARDGIYRSHENFEKLPLIVQKAVGTPEQLEEWGKAIDPSHVWHSQFLRSYRAQKDRADEERTLPPKMRLFTQSLVEKTTSRRTALPESADDGWDEIIRQRNTAQNAPQIAQNDDIETFRQTDYSPRGAASEALKKAREALRADA